MNIIETLQNREYNPKCVAISGAVVGAYWLLPPRSVLLAAALGDTTYVGIAQYDTMFGCEERLHSFDGWFARTFGPLKPPVGADGTYGG